MPTIVDQILAFAAPTIGLGSSADAHERLSAGFEITDAGGDTYRFTPDRTLRHLEADHEPAEAHRRLIRLEMAVETILSPWATNDYTESFHHKDGKVQWSRPCRSFIGIFDIPHVGREVMLVRAVREKTHHIITYHTVDALRKVGHILDERRSETHRHGTLRKVFFKDGSVSNIHK